MNSPAGRVAIVTGGARGIGFEIGAALARSGLRVALTDLNGPGAADAAAVLTREGGESLGVEGDVSRPEDVKAMVASVGQRWGRIDVLVNNAGICPMTPFLEIGADEWDSVLAVNLKGAFLCCQAVVPWMLSQGAGKIVNIASSAGQMGGIAVGLHYSASKAGILGLTKSLARALAPQIQVNAVSPGTTESEMTNGWEDAAIANIIRQIPAGRLGRPVDVAAAVEFLVSEQAGFITGQTLNVNGGLYMV
jgi:NAD(P)-dependent dehydrogenase (short-subunit alcohol dehydrogenase family)